LKKRKGIFGVLLFVFFLVVLFALGIGPTRITIQKMVQVRLPRVILGIFAGSNLAIVGAALQGILLNPLADPYILGISSGAAFGAAFAIVLGISTSFTSPILGFLGALLSIYLVYHLARFDGRIPRDTLLLTGVLVGFFFSSLVTLTLVLRGEELRRITYLLMGNLGFIFTRTDLLLFGFFFALVLTCSVIIYSYSRELNLLTLGEEGAMQLGVEAESLKKILFLASAVSIGGVVAFCGAIGFVGLIVPHVTRILVGPDHRILLPASFLMGAIFVLIADTIARTVSPMELPVGVVTSLFGVPFFVYLLRKERRLG
jgi:iron complex transport system permease protein